MNDNHDSSGEDTLYDQGNFEKLFCSIAIALKDQMDRHELGLLRQTFIRAYLCNIAFNGLGGCNGTIKPERERNRIALEQTFMIARDRLSASRGWKRLPSVVRQRLERTLLRVEVKEENLAK